jgi:hypothetical protein
MVGMARKRTTIILSPEDERLLREASREEGLSQSALIRKGIRAVTSSYRRKARPRVGWLKLTARERAAILHDELGDFDE